MRLLNWFRRSRLENDLDRELRYHFDRRVTDLTAGGMPESAARRQAGMELGGMTQVREEVRDVWLTRWLRDFVYDLRFSARSFRRSPTFTATAVLSLALGIGATTAIYSLVDQVLLHSLPVREPSRLVLVDWKGDQVAYGFGSYNLMSYPLCRDLQQQDRFFSGVLCRALFTVNLSTGGETKPTGAEIVSGSYFETLGVGPAAGRVFNAEDDGAPGAHPVVVLSHDYWQTQLGGSMDVVGRKVLINQHPMTVVGVAAAGFRGVDVGEVPSVWIPAAMSMQVIPGFTELNQRRTRWMQILGRLQPGITAAQAQAGLQPWFKSMLDEDTRRAGFPNITAERRARFLASTLELTPAAQGHSSMRRTMERPLRVMFGATGVLLALACLNVAGLFLARGSARMREVHTRLALGASRNRIGRQLLSDSLLIALAGGLLGLALAPLATRALITFLPRNVAANALTATVDGRLMLFTLAVSVAAGILSGLTPAFQAGRESMASSLRERGGPTSGGIRLRKAVVTLQIAFTLVLVVGAALFARSLSTLLARGPGFRTSGMITFGLEPWRNGATRDDASRLIRRVYARLRETPETRDAAAARFQMLVGGSWSNPMTIRANERITTDRDVHLNAITPGFFATMGVRLVAGRNFTDRDWRPVGEAGMRSAIVNEAFVERYLKGQNPLGMLVCQGNGPDAKPDIEIVGVVSNFSYRGMREMNEQAFFSLFEGQDTDGKFYVPVSGSAEQTARAIRRIVAEVDPGLPLSYFRTLDDQVNRSLTPERILATLSTAFGGLALVLSLVGIYGVMSFAVTQRTREIGIRMALGATGGSAIWMVLRDALLMIAAGIAIAWPCVGALGKLVESQLFDVKPTDPVVVLAATAVLAAASIGAALVPAYRASTVSPTDALRSE